MTPPLLLDQSSEIQRTARTARGTGESGGVPRGDTASPHPSTSPPSGAPTAVRHDGAVTSTPGWATRIARERSARNWSQALAVSNLQAVYERSTGKSAGTSE